MTYEELQESLLIFGLGERATLKEINDRHRKLVKQFHPDAGEEQDNEQIQRVNTSCRALLAYVESYDFHLLKKNFTSKTPSRGSGGNSRTPPCGEENIGQSNCPASECKWMRAFTRAIDPQYSDIRDAI